MEKININKFFENVEHLTQNEQRVNVLYLTTACNLRCNYCYEANARETIQQKSLTKKDIDAFLDEIKTREAGKVSTVVFMGGEPLLEYKLAIYALTEMAKSVHSWGVTLTTNGTISLGKDNLLDLISFDIYDNISFALEVSYDGSGQESRVYPNGKSSRHVVEAFLDEMLIDEIPFCISYTVHKGNYQNLLRDLILICEKYEPEKISLSPYCKELDSCTGDYKKFIAEFIPYAEYITTKYNIPICDLSCKVCGRCDKKSFVGNSYLSPTTGITYQDKTTEKIFDKF